MKTSTTRQRELVDRYAETAARLEGAAQSGRVVTGISSANVDHVYYVDDERLRALCSASTGDLPQLFPTVGSVALADAVVDRARHGRGGFIIEDWPEGPVAFTTLLGIPDRVQVGGAMPQAAWALTELGAPAVVALADRSSAQLDALDSRIQVVDTVTPTAVADTRRTDVAGKPPHIVLEFIAGTTAGDVTIRRSTRLILIFGRHGIEKDDAFVDWAIGAGNVPVLVSGLAFARLDAPDFGWVRDATHRLRHRGAVVHHELTEFPTDSHFDVALVAVHATSIGLSLSELPGTGDPSRRAAQLADRAGVERVVVHADHWSLSVHRSDPAQEERALWGGNVLAAARAEAGQPARELHLPARARFAEDLPTSGRLGDGWRATAAPSPYLPDPAATIGLGDTFTGGFLLSLSTL